MDKHRFQLVNVLMGIFHIVLFYAVVVLTDLTVWPISTGALLSGSLFTFTVGVGNRITLIESAFDRGEPIMISFFVFLTFAATTGIIPADIFTSIILGFGIGSLASVVATSLLLSE